MPTSGLEGTQEVRDRAKNGNTNWLLLLSVCAALVIGMSFGAILYRSWNSNIQRANVCEVALAVRDATTALLIDAQTLVKSPQTKMTPQQRKQALDFYARNIRRLNEVNCNSKGG